MLKTTYMSYKELMSCGVTHENLMSGAELMNVKEENFQDYDWTNEAEPCEYFYPVPKKETPKTAKDSIIESINKHIEDIDNNYHSYGKRLLLESVLDRLYKELGKETYKELNK